MKITRDELEFAISQYHDGDMPPLERNVVEQALANNADAREILAEYRRLDGALRSEPTLALPTMDWDRVHAQLSGAIANEAAPVKTLRMPDWTRWVGTIAAVAAAVAIVVTVLIRRDNQAIQAKAKFAGAPIVQITVAAAASHAQPVNAVAQVLIGPSPQVAQANWAYLDDSILNRPARVIIAGDVDTAQDGGSSSPYQ